MAEALSDLALVGERLHRIGRICYTVPQETAMAAAIGLLDAGLHMVRADALGDTEEIE